MFNFCWMNLFYIMKLTVVDIHTVNDLLMQSVRLNEWNFQTVQSKIVFLKEEDIELKSFYLKSINQQHSNITRTKSVYWKLLICVSRYQLNEYVIVEKILDSNSRLTGARMKRLISYWLYGQKFSRKYI